MLLLVILFCSGIKGEDLLASNGTRPLPIFIRPHGMMAHRFMENPIQAIITSYRFDCCGVVTEWRAFVEGSGGAHFKEQPYTISFQVWRPNSPSTVDTDGCYTMQGTNHFPSFPLADDRSADRGIVTGIPLESERIEVQPGDVVGFYLESSHMMDRNHDGIQFAPDSVYKNEAVWYATGSYSKGPTDCPFPVGPRRVLSSSTNRAPLITATVSTTNRQPISIAVRSTTPPLQTSTTTPTEPLPAYAVGLFVTIAATTVVILVFLLVLFAATKINRSRRRNNQAHRAPRQHDEAITVVQTEEVNMVPPIRPRSTHTVTLMTLLAATILRQQLTRPAALQIIITPRKFI